MKEHLFFDIKSPIEEVADLVFKSLGMKNGIQEGDSSHVLGGVYYSSSVFGVEIKLESNSYDYDDKYNFVPNYSLCFHVFFHKKRK